ncbi:hypothetical protein [Silvimonas sp.]|uniref:hypothetical protein n=1 Tax=Silvimonas sp. TaxID=2650811 RepID=UPI00284C523B|nr:hypothetical protein [Silvimonas sp.]MDR3428996.1 hypothetical protein [Silvimonas sp.]
MVGQYIAGVAIPAYETQVEQVIAKLNLDGGGTPMVIAIENENGAVYRVFTAIGLGAYVRSTQAMLGLGMRDRLADLPTSREGFDSRFHF